MHRGDWPYDTLIGLMGVSCEMLSMVIIMKSLCKHSAVIAMFEMLGLEP